jgi:Tol biopolymer transport system component
VGDSIRFAKAGEGYFSPDCKTIVYQAIRPEYPFYQIYSQPLDGGKPKLISTGVGRTTCAYFTPDGKRILFASAHLNPNLAELEEQERERLEAQRKSGRRGHYAWPFDPYMDIWVSDLDGRILTRLTSEPGYDAEGAYSRDGKKIAYCHVHESPRGGDDGPSPNPEIYVMNADGSDKRRITNAPGYDGGPFISPDGNWIVFRTDRKKENYLQIHVIGIDGKNEVVVTDEPTRVNWAPYWHPTKPYVIWTSADHSNPMARPNYDLRLMRYEVTEGKFVPGEIIRITD